jgi:hypothetical protein
MNKSYINNYNSDKETQYKKLYRILQIIKSNISNIKQTKDNGELCYNTINIISDGYKIISKLDDKNKHDILTFLEKSSMTCKNTLWFNNLKKMNYKMVDINTDKNRITLESNIDNKKIELYIEEKHIPNKNKNSKILKEETKVDNTNFNEIRENIEKLDNKINNCMESLSSCMELLTLNLKKMNYIQSDLQNNNVMVTKLTSQNDKILNNIILQMEKSYNKDKDLKEIKDLLISKEYSDINRDNDTKGNLLHLLLQNLLQNSKQMLCKFIPKMNMWQREKTFTTIMKICENRIDICADKLTNIINKKMRIKDNQEKEGDIVETIKEVFEFETLAITKDDIRNAAFDGEISSDSDESECINLNNTNKIILKNNDITNNEKITNEKKITNQEFIKVILNDIDKNKKS